MFQRWNSVNRAARKSKRELRRKQNKCKHFYEATQTDDYCCMKIPQTAPPYRLEPIDALEDQLFTVCLRCGRKILLHRIPKSSIQSPPPGSPIINLVPSDEAHREFIEGLYGKWDDKDILGLEHRLQQVESEVADLKDVLTQKIDEIEKIKNRVDCKEILIGNYRPDDGPGH